MNVDYYTLPGGTRVMCGALLWNSKWTGWADTRTDSVRVSGPLHSTD